MRVDAGGFEDGYRAAREFLREHPEWADVLVGCYEEAGWMEEFAGAWVRERVGRWFPSLQMLVRAGVLERVRGARQGRRAYYRMVDREGVGRALRELGLEGLMAASVWPPGRGRRRVARGRTADGGRASG